ncbi:MAG: VOC family protein [Pyrinomonadaceae bacterium]
MTSAAVIGIAPILLVQNAVSTAKFYRDVLGFEIIGYFPNEPSAVYAMVRRGQAEIHFAKIEKELENSNRNIRLDTSDFTIWVPEIEQFFDEVQSGGAEIVQKIVLRSYGREFIVKDCDGHHILVVD